MPGRRERHVMGVFHSHKGKQLHLLKGKAGLRDFWKFSEWGKKKKVSLGRSETKKEKKKRNKRIQ